MQEPTIQNIKEIMGGFLSQEATSEWLVLSQANVQEFLSGGIDRDELEYRTERQVFSDPICLKELSRAEARVPFRQSWQDEDTYMGELGKYLDGCRTLEVDFINARKVFSKNKATDLMAVVGRLFHENREFMNHLIAIVGQRPTDNSGGKGGGRYQKKDQED